LLCRQEWLQSLSHTYRHQSQTFCFHWSLCGWSFSILQLSRCSAIHNSH
jgi:hypothetical protein